jgi:AraC family transcriptional activator of mtrCDE
MHRFVTLVGMSPVMMLRQLRMREAAYFLKSDHLSIGTIARAVGYETVAGFSRAFRAEFGVDPVDYRNSNRSSV